MKLILLIALVGFPCWGEPETITDLSPVFSQPSDRVTWWFLDIDEFTLRNSKSAVGTERWWYAVESWLGRRFFLSKSRSRHEADKLWEYLLEVVPLAPTDNRLKQWIEEAKRGENRVFFLTARYGSLAPQTRTHLAQAGLQANHYLLPANWEDVRARQKGLHYENGVFFAGNRKPNKGPVLRELLQSSPRPPQRVVFGDDKKENVVQVWESIRDLPLEAQVYHYAPERQVPDHHPLSDLELAWIERFFVCPLSRLAPGSYPNRLGGSSSLAKPVGG